MLVRRGAGCEGWGVEAVVGRQRASATHPPPTPRPALLHAPDMCPTEIQSLSSRTNVSTIACRTTSENISTSAGARWCQGGRGFGFSTSCARHVARPRDCA